MNREIEAKISPVHGVAGRVQQYADKEVYDSAEFKELSKKYNLDQHRSRIYVLEDGVARFVRRFHQIRDMQDPDFRQELLKDKEEEDFDETDLLISSIDEEIDPGGINALRQCRDIDVKNKVKEVRDPFNANTDKEIQKAEMFGAAQDLMINFYERQFRRIWEREEFTDQS